MKRNPPNKVNMRGGSPWILGLQRYLAKGLDLYVNDNHFLHYFTTIFIVLTLF